MSVRAFLEAHGLSAHIAAFEANHVTMADLPAISDVELRDTFGMTVYGDRRRFREAVTGLSGGAAPPVAAAPARRGPGLWTWAVLVVVAYVGWNAWTDRERALADAAKAEAARVAAENQAVMDARQAAERAEAKAAADAQAAAERAAAEAERVAKNWTSPTFGTMQWIPPGTFLMGSPDSEQGRFTDEVQHRVTLTKGFWLMEHEVTQGEWQAVMRDNPAHFKACGPNCPVEEVSWDDAVAFARRASARDGVTYALPTEAQWEYAARAGGTFTYAGSDTVVDVAWISENSGESTHPVCQKERNGWGLCDMSGNVWEWTADPYAAYPSGAAVDPTGPGEGAFRVNRGGGWDYGPRHARVAYRYNGDPGYRNYRLGLRLSRTVP